MDLSNTFIREIEVNTKSSSHNLLRIHQVSVGDVGCVVWDAALVLLKYLFTKKGTEHVTGKHVLELGSGTGVVGLAAALAGASSVIMTDLPDFVSLIKLNILENFGNSFGVKHVCDIQAKVLCWGSESDIQEIYSIESTKQHSGSSTNPCLDCILIADCVYYEEGVYHLYESIVNLLNISHLKTKVLCSFEQRDTGNKKELLEIFLNLFSTNTALMLEYVPMQDMDEEYRSDDIQIIIISKNVADNSQ